MMSRHQFSRASYAAIMVLLNQGIKPEERYKIEDALGAADSFDELPEDVRKKVEPTFTPALKEHLAKKGFDPQMGARPMARLIQDTIRKALADELLFGRLANGGKVTGDLDAEGKVRLAFDEEVASVA